MAVVKTPPKIKPGAKAKKPATPAFECESIVKRQKGKMILLYAVVGGEEQHMASFFHDDKAEFVLAAVEAGGTKVKREKPAA